MAPDGTDSSGDGGSGDGGDVAASAGPEGYVRVADAADLEREGAKRVTADGRTIALFAHDGDVHAVDNRCPHMGFPLIEGSVEDGILTCHWHHARFELSCGDTFDPWADDVQDYPVAVHDGGVYVDPNPEPELPPAEHWARRLETGMEENLRLVIAKAVIGLDDGGVPYTEPLASGVEFGTRYRDAGWSSGLTILGCMANVVDVLDPADRRRALYTGLRHVADDCDGEPPRFEQPSFSARDLPADRLKNWFRDTVEVRDGDGAERCLRTAIDAGLSEDAVAEILFAAATDHLYLDSGHTLDFINKAFETLDHVGFEHAEHVLPSLIERLTDATRSEELSSWRQPVDLAELLFDTYEDLDDLVAAGADETWERPPEPEESNARDDLLATLLDDDPHAVVDALAGAIEAGATTTQLADVVCDAAATRVAQFATANEFSDWNTVHHTFTYCNAVREATHRTDAAELYRGVMDGAMNVYLDRFLNTPPAPLPEPGTTDRDPDAITEDLLETFDTEGEVDVAAGLVGEYLDAVAAGDAGVDGLKRTLGHGLLREDAGFHTLQAYECGLRQYERADRRRAERTALVAVGRYMAAHFPTRREAEQTFTIADRLHRGERIHEGAGDAGTAAGDD